MFSFHNNLDKWSMNRECRLQCDRLTISDVVVAIFVFSGSSVLDTWPLTRAIQDTMQVPQTHDRPINQVLC